MLQAPLSLKAGHWQSEYLVYTEWLPPAKKHAKPGGSFNHDPSIRQPGNLRQFSR